MTVALMISPVRGSADGAADAPAARGAVHPVDHVVADVHGVGAVGQHGDLEGIAEAGGFEGLVPPARAFDQRLAHVFRRAGVHPIFDGLHGLADGGGGVLLFQAVAAHVALHHRLADGRAVVDEIEAAVAGARIVVARLVVAVGQFDQGIVLAQGDRFGGGSDAGDGAGEQAAAEAAAPAAAPAAAAPAATTMGAGLARVRRRRRRVRRRPRW